MKWQDERDALLPAPATPTQVGPYLGAPTAPVEDELDLRAVWRLLVAYRRTVLGCVAACLVCALLWTLVTPAVYKATTLIQVRPEASGVRFETLEPVVGFGHREHLETQARILRSRSIAWNVIQELELASEPGFSRTDAGLLARFERGIGGASATASEENDGMLLERFLDALDVSASHRSDLLEISFESRNPELAARVANAVVEAHVRHGHERRFRSSSGAKSFLAQEIARVESGLEQAELRLNRFAREHNVVDLEEKTNIVSTRLGEMSRDLTQAVGERVSAEASVHQLEAGGPGAIAGLSENELIRTLQDRRSELVEQYGKLSRVYKPEYVTMQQLRAQIDEVDGALRTERTRVAGQIHSDFQRAKRREELLRNELELQKQALLDLRDRGVEYHILKREWEAERDLHAALLERMNEIGVAGGLGLDTLVVVDPASPPARPDRPRLAWNLAVALAIGLALGGALAFFRSTLDDRVEDAEEFERLSGYPSLGSVPRVSAAERPTADGLRAATGRTALAEAVRAVRTSLVYASPEGPPRVIQVTSGLPEEGKTTLSVQLGALLAQTGSRVLLVDADLRRPRLHRFFGVPARPGLADALVGRGKDNIRTTGIPNLAFLPAGPTPPNPCELLGSPGMDRLLAAARAKFDVVLLDSAPLLGLSDSLAIATRADGVILVVAADGVRKEGLREIGRRLRMVRARVLGGVLNMVDERRVPYGSYGYGDHELARAQQGREPAPAA